MKPEELVAWVCAGIISLIGVVLVVLIARGRIDLRYLLVEGSDPEHKASLAKLQFLIFTFVIALSLFAITIKNHEFPDIHPNIMVLLGISAGTTLGASGIASAERLRLAELRKANPATPVNDL